MNTKGIMLLFLLVIPAPAIFAYEDETPFLQRMLNGEKNPDNGICDDGENYLLDDDCNHFMLNEIFYSMWFIRLLILASLLLFIAKHPYFPVVSLLIMALLVMNNAFGTIPLG